MNLRTFALAAILGLLLMGCSAADGPPVMPQVVGKTLETAQLDIKNAGYKSKVGVKGGGLFGVLEEANWEVCEQIPDGGKVIDETPQLTIERSCSKDDETPEPQAPTAQDEPEVNDEEPEDSEDEPEETAEEPEKPKESKSEIDPQAMEATYLEHLHNSFVDGFEDMCDEYYTHWACFYNGVEAPWDYLQVNLLTDGGWSEEDLAEMARTAGTHWFNFIGCDYPDLTTIVVSVNGLDHNIFRHTTNVDLMCN